MTIVVVLNFDRIFSAAMSDFLELVLGAHETILAGLPLGNMPLYLWYLIKDARKSRWSRFRFGGGESRALRRRVGV